MSKYRTGRTGKDREGRPPEGAEGEEGAEAPGTTTEPATGARGEAGGRHRHGDGETEVQDKTIVVLYANAQSINSKLNKLKVTSQDLNPDIIILTETWCNGTAENTTLEIENYKIETDLRRDRSDTANGIGGGILVYSRQEIKILPSDKHQHSKFNQFCTSSVVTQSEKLNVILIYRPAQLRPRQLAGTV